MAWEVKAGRNAREVSSTKTRCRCFLGVRLMEKTTPSPPPRRALCWSAKMASGSAGVLERLRGAMRSSKYVSEPLTAYIILTDDAHQNEYIADCDKRREFMTGFTGSAGVAVVTMQGAWLWTDGRYHLQASQQMNPDLWTLMKQGTAGVPSLEEWLSKELAPDSRIGFDPSLTSYKLHKKYSEAVEYSGQLLVSVSANLVDSVWDSRPPRPSNPVTVLPLQYSGRSWRDKVGDVRREMGKKKASALVLTAMDEIAWLLNLRGSDIDYNPLFFSYARITLHDVRLYTEIVSEEVKEHLCGGVEGGVVMRDYGDIWEDVRALVSDTEGKIWINSGSSQALVGVVPRTRWLGDLSPVQLLKAVKNETEARGMRDAHVRDGAALCEYLCWLEGRLGEGSEVTEISAADKLESLRMEQPDFVSLSFPTISSSGPHGAIIHYCPTPATDRSLSRSELYLCDSGAQYRDGTTDVTRTVHFGTPTEREKEAFTLVLKGHIALCTLVFPSKTHGHRIEALARAPLWSAGLDYRHGTGHGVGAFLCVHEGPMGIHLRPYPEGIEAGMFMSDGPQGVDSRVNTEPLEAGMFISDEPGYYEDGEFGIRIENVVHIVPAQTKYKFGGTEFLTMDPVTMAPIQKKMIEPTLLTEAEIGWLNSYHSTVVETVGAYLREAGKDVAYRWLLRETEPLG